MERRNIGKSGLSVSALTLGAWAIGGWMWGGTDRKQSLGAIRAALESGITSIDTAPVYGFGLSEEIVGEAVRGRRDRCEILTKAGMRWDGEQKGAFFFTTQDNRGRTTDIYRYSGYQSIIRECEESLVRLGTDYIDLYQIHWPDSTTPVEETMEAMERLLQAGKIRAVGVSNYLVEQMSGASAVVQLASNQVPYSMVRREIEKDVVPWCLENHCGILAYSPLQRGLLTGKVTPDYPFAPGDSRPDTPHFRIDNLIRINAFLERILPLAHERGVTLSQLVIRWTLQQPGISAVLVGARNEQQVKENTGSVGWELGDEEIATINRELEALELDID